MEIKIYLDTSIINFLFADDAPEKKDITIEYFEKYIKTNYYQHLVSPYVIEEINNTGDENKRKKLIEVIEKYEIEVWPLEKEEEIRKLASAYISAKIVPDKKIFDALHVAFCTVNKIDVLLSWNFKHLANLNKEKAFTSKNIDLGYWFTSRLDNPMEMFNE